jgi:thioredoxin 1
MMNRLLTLLVATATMLMVTSCNVPAVQKSNSKPKSTTQSKVKPNSSSATRSAKAQSPKQKTKPSAGLPNAKQTKSPSKASDSKKAPKPAPKQLPRLVDLGAGKCIPCKMMAPILEELAREYKGKLKVEFIDVWQNPEAARKYGVRVIPTQIFYDEKGEEFFRHEGFYSKEDILRKFKDQGIDLGSSQKAR